MSPFGRLLPIDEILNDELAVVNNDKNNQTISIFSLSFLVLNSFQVIRED